MRIKIYIVTWNSNEKRFEDIQEAVKFAEKTGEESGSNTYVWAETDGIRDKEPFFSCEWNPFN